MASEFSFRTVDEARQLVGWLARRRKMSLTALLKTAKLGSQSLLNFATQNLEARKRQDDANAGPIMQLLEKHDHLLLLRPIGGKHVVLSVPGAVPLQIRNTDGGLLELPIGDYDQLRTAIVTLTATNGVSPSGLAIKAGLSSSIVSFVSRTKNTELRISQIIQLAAAAGFELVVRQKYANQQEARFAQLRNINALQPSR